MSVAKCYLLFLKPKLNLRFFNKNIKQIIVRKRRKKKEKKKVSRLKHIIQLQLLSETGHKVLKYIYIYIFGQELLGWITLFKFVLKPLALTITGHIIFFCKIDLSMNPGRPRWQDD